MHVAAPPIAAVPLSAALPVWLSTPLLAALAGPILAQEPASEGPSAPTAVATPPPLPTAVELEQRVAGLFRGCARPGTPGAVVLVARGDEVLVHQAYGAADIERDVPLSTDSVFDIASTSKQFTAACVLLLEIDGVLALDDPLRRHVAELPGCCEPVLLRHLISHTSGLPDYIGLLQRDGSEVEDRTTGDDALDALAGIEALQFAPGERFEYSNSNYFLLAEVVARISGRSLADFARERIFEPLGMTSTHVHADCTELVPRRAFSYSRSVRGGWRWNFSNWEQTGDGAVFTTTGDLARWARNFRTHTVGGEALAAAMARRFELANGETIDYGTGLVHGELDGVPTISHGGAWAGYRAELLRVPDRDLVVVCLCNRDDFAPTLLAQRIARAALGH